VFLDSELGFQFELVMLKAGDHLINVMMADKDTVEAVEFCRVYLTIFARHVLSPDNEVVEQQNLALPGARLSPELIDKARNLGGCVLLRNSTDSDRPKINFSTP
jgi:phenylpropionate dioxygenase-like ring-hydroxylating dioxygenase large terminal subunit